MIKLKNLIKEAITGSDRKIMHMIIREEYQKLNEGISLSYM